MSGAVIAAAAVLIYSKSISFPFLYDDDSAIVNNATIRHFGTAFWPPPNTTVAGRPSLNLSFALNYAISGAAWSYHAFNLTIHILAGLTLFGIVRRTLALRAREANTAMAFSVALLWTVHPLHTEAVTYICQRAESLMGLLYLLSLYCFTRGVQAEERPRFSTRSLQARWFSMSVTACAIGMGTKEVMVSAPLIVLLYDRTFVSGNFRDAWRQRRLFYTALASTWLILAYLVFTTTGRRGTFGLPPEVASWRYALTQLVAVVHYLKLSFWPHPLVFDYGTELYRPSLQILPYAIVVIALVAATIWALVKRPAEGFLGFCFFAILAPSSSIVPVAIEPLAEHRMYLALIPIVMLVVQGIYRGLGHGALMTCLVLSVGLSWATWQRNDSYRTNESLWADTVAKRPDNERAHYNLGWVFNQLPGRKKEAVAQYEEALRLKPDLVDAHYNLANLYYAMPGRINDAVAQYEEALRLKPDLLEAHFNLARALSGMPARLNDAVTQYEEALRLQPDNAKAHDNLGGLLSVIPGRLNEAIAQFKTALRLQPDSADTHYNFGCVLAQMPGRLDDASAEFEEALRLRLDFFAARCNLGNVFSRMPGHLDGAVEQYKEALRLQPDSAEVHFNLGYVLLQLPGQLDEASSHFERVVNLRPDFAPGWHNLGACLFRLGKFKAAATAFREEVHLSPNDPTARQALATALGQTGEQ
jgi:tetratricopeptide (TPR) repeat protein